MKIDDEHALAVIFKKLSAYYSDGGMGYANNPNHADLCIVYLQLSEAFGINDAKTEADNS